jgi:hypothetical protein
MEKMELQSVDGAITKLANPTIFAILFVLVHPPSKHDLKY